MLKTYKLLLVYVLCSPAAAFNTFDPSASEVIGHKLIETVPPTIEAAKLGPCQPLMDDGSSLPHEVFYTKSNELKAHKAAVKWTSCKSGATQIILEFIEENSVKHVSSVEYSLVGKKRDYELSYIEAKSLADGLNQVVANALKRQKQKFLIIPDPIDTPEQLKKINRNKGYEIKIKLQK